MFKFLLLPVAVVLSEYFVLAINTQTLLQAEGTQAESS